MVAIRKGHLQEWPLVSIHVVQVVKKVLTEQSFTRTLKQRERLAMAAYESFYITWVNSQTGS